MLMSTGLMGLLLTAGLLIAVPVAAFVAWLSSRRFERVLAFAVAGVLATLVPYVASGRMAASSGLLLAEPFTDVLLFMVMGASVGALFGALRRSPSRAGSKAS
jgi:hypothetical protein